MVQDNGVGMSEEELELVRQSLAMETEVTVGQRFRNRTSSSSGVGLINVYQRLRLYYGEQLKLSIESEEFQGTLVTIILPVQARPEEAEEEYKEYEASE
ncbi:ATP-binding protein [Paenibacillus sp. D2_2]|uniref:sensor histidine kinase n=1 Tax=Paenibacillus sp. D2_2 TaxID=3073092 RepID=UPI002815D0F4|nr:ATP-binding protein [Paenibacillus sp. D2_2]WMT40083.1 ATP-binding protein [Paenibacillus sp. D2_2]